MDRRLFIVALAGLSANSGLAFAQSSKMGTMGDEEKKHILETLQVVTMSWRRAALRSIAPRMRWSNSLPILKSPNRKLSGRF